MPELFEEHSEAESSTIKTLEPKKPHRQIETITVLAYPYAMVVTKLGDRFERYDLKTDRLPKLEFEAMVRELTDQILGIWHEEESYERKKAKISGTYRINLDPISITDGKLYELAKKRLLDRAGYKPIDLVVRHKEAESAT